MLPLHLERKSTRTRVPLVPVLVVLAALGGGSCRSLATPAPPLSDAAVRLELPLVRQDALYDCGLASISALCQYWGIRIPEEQRVELARTAARNEGLSGDELLGALRRLGLETYLFEGSLDRATTGVYAHVDAGRPPLVMLSPDGTAHHYELVLGYDEPRGNLILLDPMKGEIVVPVTLFERDWARCRRFTLLACLADHAQIARGRDDSASSSAQLTQSTSTDNEGH